MKVLLEDNENAPNLINKNDHYDNTPLHIACREGHEDTVEEILNEAYSANIDKKNEDEQTPCHLAAKNGHLEALKLLIQKDPNAIFDKDEDDNTPLHLAATKKNNLRLLIISFSKELQSRKEMTRVGQFLIVLRLQERINVRCCFWRMRVQ